MTEIYRGSSSIAILDLSGVEADTAPTAVAVHSSEATPIPLTVTEDTNAPAGTQRWTAPLTIVHTQSIHDFVVKWEFAVGGYPVAQEQHYEVVTPLVSTARIREELFLGADVTDADLILAERRVRRIIEDVCGQTFSLRKDTLNVKASRDPYLRLPERLFTLESATSAGYPLNTSLVQMDNDGWVLYKINAYPAGIIYSPKHVIDDPYSAAANIWRSDTWVSITGYWGWEKVPSAVEEAALILIEDRLCPETTYRDKYLETMTAADWRIQFNPEAYRGTGNAVADQILRNFIVRAMAVI